MERQIHGFNFENYIINKFNLTKKENYTDKWDAEFNSIPVSIKTHEISGGIELGDIYRISQINSPFYLIVGFWKNQKDNIVEEHIAYIDDMSWWKSLFDYELLKDFKTFLDSVSNNSTDDKKWKEGRLALSKKWVEKTPNIIKPRWKRDHKKQKRIQCAISYSDFISKFNFIGEEEWQKQQKA